MLKKEQKLKFFTLDKIIILILIVLIVGVIIGFIISMVSFFVNEAKKNNSLEGQIISKLNYYDEKHSFTYIINGKKYSIWIVPWEYNNFVNTKIINSFVKYEPHYNEYDFYIAFKITNPKYNNSINLLPLAKNNVKNINVFNDATISKIYLGVDIQTN